MEDQGQPRRNSLSLWHWTIAGGVAVCAIAVMFAGTGVLSATTDHPNIAAAPDPKIACSTDPTLSVALTGPPASYHRVATVLFMTWKVVNDEASGSAGYWAMNSYLAVLHVWLVELAPHVGGYWALETFNGNFQVPQGALSPGMTGTTPNAVPEPASGYGTMMGGYAGLITPTPGISYSWPGLPTAGYLGMKNYGGTTSDLLLGTQTGDTTPYTWLTIYFGATATFYSNSGIAWGWVYTLNSFFQSTFQSTTSVNQWCNLDTGEYGDIVTSA